MIPAHGTPNPQMIGITCSISRDGTSPRTTSPEIPAGSPGKTWHVTIITHQGLIKQVSPTVPQGGTSSDFDPTAVI